MPADIWASVLREAHTDLAGLSVAAAGDSTTEARVGIGAVDLVVFVADLDVGAIVEAGAGGVPVGAIAAVAGSGDVLRVLAVVPV